MVAPCGSDSSDPLPGSSGRQGEGFASTGQLDEFNQDDQLSPPTSTSPDPSCAVHKVILRHGTGPVVPLHSTCLVRHAGRILSTGDIFVDDSEKTPLDGTGNLTHVVAGRDAVRVNRGLYQAVGTMRKGEVCHVWVDSSMGYGSTGNFSFPSVPPNADLSYAIELVDYEPPPSEQQTADGYMTYEQRLEAAKRRRVQGNEAFALGTLEGREEALANYKAALAFLDDDFMMQLYDFHYDTAMEEKTSVMLNMAACYLKLDRPREAASVAGLVLAHDGKNVKALYRRGMSRRILGQTKDALGDLERAKELAEAGGAGDAGITRELALVKAALRREHKAQGTLYKSMMEKVMANMVADDRGGGESGLPKHKGLDKGGQHGQRGQGGVDTLDASKASEKRTQGRAGAWYRAKPVGLLSVLLGFVLRLWKTIFRFGGRHGRL